MITAKKILALSIVLLVTMAMSVPALGVSEFLFLGNSKYVIGEIDAVGSVMEVYGIMTSVGGVSTPIPVDMDNYEYTVSITGMVVTSSTNVPPTIKTVGYNGGEIIIYKDPIVGGTAADFADIGTFINGEQILLAMVDPGWTALLYDFDLDLYFAGSGNGSCDFYDGTQLMDLVAAEYYLDDWGFLGTPVADANPPNVLVPDGFDRKFDVKLTPPNDPTFTVPGTWGQVKGLYR